ncbi:MAG TPA: gamma-glutamyltransferase, partial [Asanoa sp.]
MPIARFARLLVVALVALVVFDPQAALAQEKQPTAVGSGGAAASVDVDGTRAAIQALRDGGNAVDAAVAASSVLGVTEPYSCGIGGGGFMVIRTAGGKVTTIDGREESPATMRPDSFWENGKPL